MTTAGSIWLGALTAIIAAALIGGSPATANAGETSVYLKSGWYTWKETVNGSSFVKEKGFLHGGGVSRRDDLTRAFSIAERIELWGGVVDYDGHDVTGTTPLNADTTYFGTREEVALSVKIPASAEKLSVQPFAGVGHKFWLRTRSSEDWNTIYGRTGVSLNLERPSGLIFVKGGIIVPFYTRAHVALSDAGYEDVVTEPKSRVAAFAEGGVQFGDFTLSMEYEGMEFGKSDDVPVHGHSSGGTGALVNAGVASQPDSSSHYVSLKLTYTFY